MRGKIINKCLYWLFGLVSGCLLILQIIDDCYIENEPISTSRSLTVTTGKEIPSSRLMVSSFSHSTTTNRTKGVESVSINTTALTSNTPNESNISTEWLSCKEVEELFWKTKQNKRKLYVKGNRFGNKEIYFTEIKNRTGQSIQVVLKHSVIKNMSFEGDLYRHRSSIREIENLRKLQSLRWSGIPQLLGACVHQTTITYVVTRIIGIPLCDGNGTDMNCALSKKVINFLKETKDPQHTALVWLSKVTCFFQQFERDRVFMEDISGINFYYSPKTLDLYLVDADSLIFYDEIRLGSSRSSCRVDQDCAQPRGNLWRYHALNHKIYYSCQESQGYCSNNTCSGYDVTLHTCGIGRWIVAPLRYTVHMTIVNDFKQLMRCMLKRYPHQRCSFESCCEESKKMIEKLETSRSRLKGFQ